MISLQEVNYIKEELGFSRVVELVIKHLNVVLISINLIRVFPTLNCLSESTCRGGMYIKEDYTYIVK